MMEREKKRKTKGKKNIRTRNNDKKKIQRVMKGRKEGKEKEEREEGTLMMMMVIGNVNEDG